MGTAEQRNQRIKQELENWGSDFRNRLSVPEIALTALLYTRFRYVLWALFAVSVLGILWFGLQDVGSYYGYEAGSLFRPEHYVDTAWTATFGDSYGFSAADINRELSAMRLANLPGVLGCGVVLLASAALTFWVGLGALLAGGVWEALFKMEPSVQRFFLERYRIDHPTESGRPAIEDVARYAWQYVCDKRCDTGIPGTVIDAEMVYELRKFLAQEKLFGGYLALNGLRATKAPVHLEPLLPWISVRTPTIADTASAGAQHAQQVAPAIQAPVSPPAPQGQGAAAASTPSAPKEPLAPTVATEDAGAKEIEAPVQPEAQEAGARFCPQCGTRFPDGAKFCPQCGTSRL